MEWHGDVGVALITRDLIEATVREHNENVELRNRLDNIRRLVATSQIVDPGNGYPIQAIPKTYLLSALDAPIMGQRFEAPVAPNGAIPMPEKADNWVAAFDEDGNVLRKIVYPADFDISALELSGIGWSMHYTQKAYRVVTSDQRVLKDRRGNYNFR